MQIEYAKNPVWADAEHTMIDLTIKWDIASQEHPFTASQNDVEAHGRAIFAAAVAGKFGAVAEYVEQQEESKVTEEAIFPTPASGSINAVVF
jgi:ribosomal protein L31